MNNSHKYFRNVECSFFPCHEQGDSEQFNCLFCYCPLYSLGDQCGGNFEYSGKTKKIKNCTNCIFPHEPGNYYKITAKLKQINDRKKAGG